MLASWHVYTISLVESAAPPIVSSPVLVDNIIVMQWNHTDKGPCFAYLTFSYNITWYPVVGGTGQMEAAESAVVSNHNSEGTMWYVITNLLPNTSYQVEIVGFTSTSPQVFSEPVTVETARQSKTCTCPYIKSVGFGCMQAKTTLKYGPAMYCSALFCAGGYSDIDKLHYSMYMLISCFLSYLANTVKPTAGQDCSGYGSINDNIWIAALGKPPMHTYCHVRSYVIVASLSIVAIILTCDQLKTSPMILYKQTPVSVCRKYSANTIRCGPSDVCGN